MAEAPVRWDIRDGAFVATIDNPPVNVLSTAVRGALVEAADAAEAALASGAASRVILTGAGKAFVAGADAREFDLPPMAPHLPDVIGRWTRLPAIAAINGAALGGGLELALACRVRIAHPKAVLGLPEVNLGIVPGSGGTQRLPRLIGIAAALPLIAEGRTMRADEALRLGVVDEVADDVVAAALTVDATRLNQPSVDERPRPAPAPEMAARVRAEATKRFKGQLAPQCAIDLVEASAVLPIGEGLAEERRTFLDLRSGEQAKALRHMFFAERAAGASKEVARLTPAPVEHALVAGGGTMGAAIAYALASAGVQVTLLEADANAEARARANVAAHYADAVKRGKLTAGEAASRQAASFTFHSGADAPLPPVDLAIEAVFEDLQVKRALFARLDAGLPKSTVLATNTSYLDVEAIAEGLSHPERFLGLHFFAPAHIMRLLEIIRARHTSPETLATGFALAKRLGKIAVEAGACDGFIGNRILTRYRQAADILLREGCQPHEVDAAVEEYGMAMGPYAAQDLSGLDIAYANRQRKGLRKKAGVRYIAIADRLVEQEKRLGRKTDAGWYDYDNGVRKASALVARIVESESAAAGLARRSFAPDGIARRCMLAMIAEGLDILSEGIARRPADIDLVLVHGYGFPRWRGGPMHLADAWGLPVVLADLERLAIEDPLTWRIPELLRTLCSRDAALASLN